MSRTLVYILIALLLGIAVWYFVIRKDNPFSAEANFSVKDTNSIGRIFLASKSGETITLDHRADGWYVNKNYKAYWAMVHNLLDAIANQTVDFPVPKSEYNNVIKEMAASSIKTEIYDKNGKLLTTYYVGGEANNGNGTFMYQEGASTPFVIKRPGLPLYLTPRYTTNFAEWRDKSVFSIPAADLRKVEVSYTEFPVNDFTFLQKDGKISIEVDPALSNNKDLNLKRANAYAGFFSNINCEGFVNGFPGMDTTIRQAEKRCTIKVWTAKDSQALTVYYMPLNKRSKNQEIPKPGFRNEYDADRSFGIFHGDKDTCYIQNQMIDKLMRAGYEFYEKTPSN